MEQKETNQQTEKEAALSKEFVEEVSRQSREFCIIGLAGKVRSGTSDVCHLLTKPDFPSLMDLPAVYQEDAEADVREYRIIFRYLRENWKPFIELSVTSVIISYLLDLKPEDVKGLSCAAQKSDKPIGEAIYRILAQCIEANVSDFKDNVLKKMSLADTNLNYVCNPKKDVTIGIKNPKLKDACDAFFSGAKSVECFFAAWKDTKDRLLNAEKHDPAHPDGIYTDFLFCFGILPALEDALKAGLKKEDRYPIAFQSFGNNIRATGSVVGISGEDIGDIRAENLFELPKRVNCFIKLLRKYPLTERSGDGAEGKEDRSPVYVVINNFKNIFEAYYFKRRYSAFYLLAVSCDEAKRREKFETLSNYSLTNLREDLSSGKKNFKAARDTKLHEKYTEDGPEVREAYRKELGVSEPSLEFIMQLFYSDDKLRKISYDKNLAPFILQDVVNCIENADIFVTRDYTEPNWQYDQQLIQQIGRTVTLILHPGLLTPTRLERCMQVAMTAKLNSGCLSRQVGAVVTDAHYNILSLGWNDSPCGAESCLRRNFFDLARKSDKKAYSDYELQNEEFRSYVAAAKSVLGGRMNELKGLPMAYCFKDIYQDQIKQRDQIYTRALHGEERALAACDNTRAKGGYLFTTSSPCELCAKRAKETGISKIYYIEQYPGISRTHITNIGPKGTRSEYVSFAGAVGLAYNKLYTPLMPYKDELAALNFSVTDAYKKAQDGGKGEPKPDGKGSSGSSGSSEASPDSSRNGQQRQEEQERQ